MALFVLLSACASFTAPVIGAPADAVLQQWGEPTARHTLPGGAQRWEYATGPEGSRTRMLDFDTGQRLVRVEQVLTEGRFATIQPGMTGVALQREIGRPADVRSAGLAGGQLWSYRYLSPFCQWFQVVVGDDGRVRETGYGEDPNCRVDW